MLSNTRKEYLSNIYMYVYSKHLASFSGHAKLCPIVKMRTNCNHMKTFMRNRVVAPGLNAPWDFDLEDLADIVSNIASDKVLRAGTHA